MPGTLPRRTLGQGLEVSCLGLGAMGMSAFYSTGEVPKEQCVATIRRAIAEGCTFIDTAELYNVGLTTDNNEQLVGEGISGAPRGSLTVATKFGVYLQDGQVVLDGSRRHCREAVEASLAFLGVDHIDLYYLHRKDPTTPIEESVAAMAELVKEGKVRHIGLSEVSAEDVRRAHAVHPITAYQLEWSLWSRDAEAEIVPLCRELGIGIVAYSPLGRGFLTGAIKSPSDLAESDYRRWGQPRFAEEAFKKNMELLEQLKSAAARKGCTPSQLALAWVLAQGPDVVPIPGTRREAYLLENLGAAAVQLSAEEAAALGDAFSDVAGDRYADRNNTFHYGDKQ